MAEAIAFVVLAGQLFIGCVQAYHFLLTAYSFESVSQKYLINLCIEQARLLIWGRNSGLAEGAGHPSLGNMAALIVRVLEYMQNSLSNAADLSRKYGLDFSPPAPNTAAQPATTVSTAWTTSVLGKSQHQKFLESESPKKVSTFRGVIRSLRWALKDESKFHRLLFDLKGFNDSLEQLPRVEIKLLGSASAGLLRDIQTESSSTYVELSERR